MSVMISAIFLKILDISSNILSDLLASKVWDKFNDDLEREIFKLIQEQNRKFKDRFPEAALELSEKEMRQVITAHFGGLTADQLDTPLNQKEIAQLFASLFLKPKHRETEKFDDIDPKYRNTISELAQDFVKDFKRKAEWAFIRNSAAATTVLLNSLARAGRTDQEMIELLAKIYRQQEDLPTLIGSQVQMQLLPGIKTEIQKEYNRFREDWAFILRVLKFDVPSEEEDQREWLEQLTQVLEWKGFANIQRYKIDEVPGELFDMEKADEFGQTERWRCWGCPTQSCPEEKLVRLAITHLQEDKTAQYFIISRTTIKDTSAQLLKTLGIRSHLTLEAFVQTILNISAYRQTIVADYEKQPIYHHFVDLQCRLRDKEDSALDLRDYFFDWLQNQATNHISLLGDFGTGKTEFCRRTQWELLKHYQAANPSRIPVLITLRDQKGLKLPQMIDNIMNTMGLKQIDYAAFRTLNRMGLFVILIDGFDEISAHATLKDMVENFRDLAVLAEGRAKVFLTCRTHYFESSAREQEVLSLPDFIAERSEFRILYLNPFNREQIEAYLDKVTGLRQEKRDVLAEMDKHPRLKELMQTPVLLDMILKIFPELISCNEPITLSLIYEKATSRWIADEKRKGHLQKLSRENVWQFMQDLAWQMHHQEKLAVNFKDLKSQTYQTFRKSMQVDTYELDAFYGEVRTCTFLTRDLLGNYKFAHKSFMEYFTAYYLSSKLFADAAPDTKINEEIRQFIHEILVPQVDYLHLPRFQFSGKLWQGMKKCEEHPNCFIHLKDNSHMVWIPPGQFIAGGELYDQEKPTRIMRLEQGSFLDKYLVTNAQYAHFLNEMGKLDDKWIDLQGSYKNEKCRIVNKKREFIVEPGYEKHPVNFVSFFGAEAYAKWAGKELPSEWLWEKAGRGIDGRIYPWGDEWDWDKCNSGEHWAKRDLSEEGEWNKWFESNEYLKAEITPVESFSEFLSPFGCFNLSGLLWEWMKELWKKDETWRVVRGGAFYGDRGSMRLACRDSSHPGDRYSYVGFRLSRTS